ncbi:hypothetical protein [uncultured Tateyamaria sp.]|uniref:hypothetical protein n=1 Tax=uncultured Tateyamaria sp. TaxID=455651 RepID=UPI00261CE656|nr:hypothetical protein [uncultured Tateyamaria sp.]
MQAVKALIELDFKKLFEDFIKIFNEHVELAKAAMPVIEAVLEGNMDAARRALKQFGEQLLSTLKTIGEQVLENLSEVLEATIGVSLDQLKAMAEALIKGDLKGFMEVAKEIVLSATGADMMLQFVDLAKAVMEGDLKGAMDIAADIGLDQVGGGRKGKGGGRADGPSSSSNARDGADPAPNTYRTNDGDQRDRTDDADGREIDVRDTLDKLGIDIPESLDLVLPETVEIPQKSKRKGTGDESTSPDRTDDRTQSTERERGEKEQNVTIEPMNFTNMNAYKALLQGRDVPEPEEKKKEVKVDNTPVSEESSITNTNDTQEESNNLAKELAWE